MMNWDVVLENQEYIKKTCMILIKNTKLDVEDFVQQVYINIATNYENFDPEKGTFNTFVYWRIMSTRRACMYRQSKHAGKPVQYDLPSNDHILMEQKAEISLIRERVSVIDREIIDDMLGKIDLDIKYQAKRARMYRLRAKIKDEVQ